MTGTVLSNLSLGASEKSVCIHGLHIFMVAWYIDGLIDGFQNNYIPYYGWLSISDSHI